MANEDEVTVLDGWASMFGVKVRIALAEKGIKYEYGEKNERNESSLLLQRNPIHKKIPVLIHNGKSVCESSIIVEYIEEFWNDIAPLLIPSDPYQRAQARFWVDFIDKMIYETGRRTWTAKGEKQDVASKEFIENLKLLDEQLGDKKYFGGEDFGFVDLGYQPYYCWFYSFRMGKFIIEAEGPKIITWAKRCMRRESVFKTLPDEKRVFQFVLHRRKVYVAE